MNIMLLALATLGLILTLLAFYSLYAMSRNSSPRLLPTLRVAFVAAALPFLFLLAEIRPPQPDDWRFVVAVLTAAVGVSWLFSSDRQGP